MRLLLDLRKKYGTNIKIPLFASVTVLTMMMMLFVSVNAVYAASHVTVEFDQEVYMPGDTAFITLVDPDGNLDSDLVDSLSVDVWSDSDPGGIDVILTETGTDTGIFTGGVILTVTDESSGNRLRVAIGETITVEAMGASDTAIIGTITPSPIIEFDKDSYTPSEIPIITLTDVGSNSDPDLIEIVNVTVFSTTDAGGIDTTLRETADNTGIFVGNVELTTTDESSGDRLRVSAGDTITTTFEDASDTATINGGDGGGCLIATAAHGTELAPQVQFLREIRDHTVMSTTTGAAFMTGFNSLYYSFSPTIADMERESPMFKDTVRAFITPMISTLSIMTLAENGSEFEVLGLGISVIALNLGMYIAVPATVGFVIHRYVKSKRC